MVEDEPDLHLKLSPASEVVDVNVAALLDERVVEGVEDGLVLDVGAVLSPAARLDLHLIDLPEVQLPLHHRPAHLQRHVQLACTHNAGQWVTWFDSTVINEHCTPQQTGASRPHTQCGLTALSSASIAHL